MNRPLPRRFAPITAAGIAALVAFTALTSSLPARADSNVRPPANTPRAYSAECASCHIAYPPSLLPAQSWARMMGTLNKHYGTDASLDEATVRQLSTWLQANAATDRRTLAAPPEDRITRSNWFVREHDEIAASVWKLASVKSAANCAACHSDADAGTFRESKLIRPAGMTAAQARSFSDD